MRSSSSSSLFKIGGAMLTVVVLMLFSQGGVAIQAGPLFQETGTATPDMGDMTATPDMGMGDMTATPDMGMGDVTTTPDAGTGGTLGTFAPCPASTTLTGTATAEAGMGGDMSATATAEMGMGDMTATPDMGTSNVAYIGLRVSAVENCGVLILEVFANGPSAQSGLAVGDVIVAVDNMGLSDVVSGMGGGMMATGTPEMGTGDMSATATADAGDFDTVTGPYNSPVTAAFFALIQAHQPGDTATLTVQRAGQQMDVAVVLGSLPSGLMGSTATPEAGTGDTGGTGGTGGTDPTTTPPMSGTAEIPPIPTDVATPAS